MLRRLLIILLILATVLVLAKGRGGGRGRGRGRGHGGNRGIGHAYGRYKNKGKHSYEDNSYEDYENSDDNNVEDGYNDYSESNSPYAPPKATQHQSDGDGGDCSDNHDINELEEEDYDSYTEYLSDNDYGENNATPDEEDIPLENDSSKDDSPDLINELFGVGSGQKRKSSYKNVGQSQCENNDGIICSDNGVCNNEGQCECDPGFGGSKCEIQRIAGNCKEIETYIKCMVLDDHFDDEGNIFNCAEHCADVTLDFQVAEPTEVTGHCQTKTLGGHCSVSFDLPAQDKVVFFSNLECPSFGTETTELGTIWANIDQCASFYGNVDPDTIIYGFITYKDDDFYNRVTYRGEMKCNFKRHGKGYLEWSDGAFYAGNFKDDIRNGKGKMHYENGDTFIGEWKNDKKNGQGKYKTVSLDQIFIGNFDSGRKNGSGEVYHANDLSTPLISGEYKNGQLVSGTIRHENGDIYEGEISGGKMHGQGRYEDNCGNVYDGTWVNGIREGQGQFIWANGEQYEGAFKDNVPHGQGTFIWLDGTQFDGLFENGYIIDEGGSYSFPDPYSGIQKRIMF